MVKRTNQERLLEYMKLTDRMIENATKEKVAEALRILALEVAHYQAKFGVLPTDEALALLRSDNLNDEQTGWVANSLENIAATLASIPDADPDSFVH